eukprot:g15524.t1
MSLFSTHVLWDASIGSSEDFGKDSLCVGNVDNEPNGNVKIVTGSFQGTLRIYYPKGGEYRIEDLMVEQQLGAPVLHLALGKFIPSSILLALAVLHPRRLVVYQVAAMGGSGKSATYYSVVKAYEHNLDDDIKHFTASNMIWGSFGSPTRTKESICVQSMDGRLQFYEQDHYAFTTQLSNCLVPGPICYCKSSDILVTSNCKREIVAYKYGLLASSCTRKGYNRNIDWSINIGEHAFDIYVSRYSKQKGTHDILVLGEHSMFCISENGEMKIQKRLDYSVASCNAYLRAYSNSMGPQGAHTTENLIVATRSRRLLVYRDAQLVWAAKCAFEPLALRVASFGELDGLIVALSLCGRLSLMYLGTDSPTSLAISANSHVTDYNSMDSEYRNLLQDIRSIQSRSSSEPASDFLSIRSQVADEVDVLTDDEAIMLNDKLKNENLANDANNKIVQVTARIFIAHSGNRQVKNLNVSVSSRYPVLAEKSVIRIRNIKGNSTPLVLPLRFYISKKNIPSSRSVDIVVTYVMGTNAKSVYHQFDLPMALFVAPTAPTKISECKFTIETNKNSLQASKLFPDLLCTPGIPDGVAQKYATQAANVLSIQYHNGEIATVLISKSSGKYRIQGSSFQSLCLLAIEVMSRVRKLYAEINEDVDFDLCNDFECRRKVAMETLTLFDYYWSMVDEHALCRKQMYQIESVINERAQQFRAIQKRLLVRFKDKNPQALSHLDLLLHETFSLLINSAESIEDKQREIIGLSSDLSCGTELLICLVSHKSHLSSASVEVLRAHLTPHVEQKFVQGWEECVDSAMTHLLRSVLAKSAKDASSNVAPIQYTENTSKLKRHFDIVCRRLIKQQTLE